MANPLTAGAAQVSISPPVGGILWGWGPRRSDSLHDELHARALVLDDGATVLALVTCDLLGLGLEVAERARALIEQQTGLPPTNVMFNCSHTHSGPFIGEDRQYGEVDQAYVQTLVNKLAGAVQMAFNDRREALIGMGTEPVQIGVNRREMTPDRGMILGHNWDGPVNPNVDVIRVDSADGRPIAVAFSHATHPIVLPGSSLAITADYPGYAAAVLEKVRGAGLVAMFAQGCGANINAQVGDRSFEDARRLGTILGAAALKASEQVELAGELKLNAASEVIELPLDLPTVAEAEEVLRETEANLAALPGETDERGLRNARRMVEWARDHLAVAQVGAPTAEPYEMQVFALGDTAIVALGSEVFVEIGLNIAERSPAAHTAVLGYCNAYTGRYVSTAIAYDEGGYEALAHIYDGRTTVPLDPSSASLIEDAAVRLLGRLF